MQVRLACGEHANPAHSSFLGDETRAQTRARMKAYWIANPTARCKDVAVVFGVSRERAMNARPTCLRGIRPSGRCERKRLGLMPESAK